MLRNIWKECNNEKYKLETVDKKRYVRKREERKDNKKDVGNHGQPHNGRHKFLEESNVLCLLILILTKI